MTSRIRALICMTMLVAPGCANTQLKVSTVRQGGTITDLQYQQVLNNLAMLTIDLDALPAIFAVKSGSTQVSDQGNAMVGLDISGSVVASPSVSGSRSIVDAWGTVPVTDDTTLNLLRMAYRSALGHPSTLDLDTAEDLAHELSAQIGTNADISTDADTLKSMVANLKPVDKKTGPASVAPQDEGISRTAGPEQIPTTPRPAPTGTTPAPGTSSSPAVDSVPAAPALPPATGQIPATPRPAPAGTNLGAGMVAGRIEYTSDQIADTLADLDDKITSTLDETILKWDEGKSPFFARNKRAATGLAKETIRQVNDIQKTLTEIQPGWFHVGGKKDVPKNACYVGHYKACGRECYVWVCGEGRAGLAKFTLDTLNLASAVKDTQVLTVPSGIQFSPVLGNPR